jgi:MFS family permease
VARRTAIGLRTIVVSAALFGVAMFGLFLVPNIDFAYPLAVLIGGTSVSYMTATTAIAQLRTRRDMIGRVLALQTVLLLGTTPIGGPILGVVSDIAGGRSPVLVGSVAAVLAAFLGLLAARRHQVFSAPEPEPEPTDATPEPPQD